jgi:hypothetical protein
MSNNIYSKIGVEDDLRNGALDTGFSTIRRLMLTLLCPRRNFWPIIA